MEVACAKRGSLFRSKKRTSLDLATNMPHTWNCPMIAVREEMNCEEGLSMLTTLLLHHRSEVALHSQRVSRIAHILAHRLCRSHEESALVALAGLFHDIGKLCIPPKILHKQGLLNTREWAIMRTHARIGSEMLLCVGGIGNQLAPLSFSIARKTKDERT